MLYDSWTLNSTDTPFLPAANRTIVVARRGIRPNKLRHFSFLQVAASRVYISVGDCQYNVKAQSWDLGRKRHTHNHEKDLEINPISSQIDNIWCERCVAKGNDGGHPVIFTLDFIRLVPRCACAIRLSVLSSPRNKLRSIWHVVLSKLS